MRCRAVYTSPTVGWHEFVGPLLRDHGYDTEDVSKATMQAIRELATVRRGRRDPNTLVGPGDYVCPAIFGRLKMTTFAACSDGIQVEINGLHDLKTSGELPNLRYQFRDRAHISRGIMKQVFKAAARGSRIRDLLVCAKDSVVHRIVHSRRLRDHWIREQGGISDMYNIHKNLSHGEQRFDNRVYPMTSLCQKSGSLVRFCKKRSLDTLPHHREEAKYFKNVYDELTGTQGFCNWMYFSMDADFACMVNDLTLRQEKSDANIARSVAEVLRIVDQARAVFLEGRIFAAEPNETYTWQVGGHSTLFFDR